MGNKNLKKRNEDSLEEDIDILTENEKIEMSLARECIQNKDTEGAQYHTDKAMKIRNKLLAAAQNLASIDYSKASDPEYQPRVNLQDIQGNSEAMNGIMDQVRDMNSELAGIWNRGPVELDEDDVRELEAGQPRGQQQDAVEDTEFKEIMKQVGIDQENPEEDFDIEAFIDALPDTPSDPIEPSTSEKEVNDLMRRLENLK